MRHSIPAAGLLLLLTGSAFAADSFEIDPGHTQVQFAVDRFGFNDTLGVFPDLKGELVLDRANPENSHVEVTVQIASIDTNNAFRDKILVSPPWFDAAKYPTMHFVSTKVERTGDDTAKVTGDLTLHGETHPITLDVKLNKLGAYPVTNGTAAGFSATGMLKRSDFGMKTAPKKFVGDDVSIRIEALAVPKTAS